MSISLDYEKSTAGHLIHVWIDGVRRYSGFSQAGEKEALEDLVDKMAERLHNAELATETLREGLRRGR